MGKVYARVAASEGVVARRWRRVGAREVPCRCSSCRVPERVVGGSGDSEAAAGDLRLPLGTTVKVLAAAGVTVVVPLVPVIELVTVSFAVIVPEPTVLA
jgi:hypothetical protein